MHPIRKYSLGAAILAASVAGGAFGAAALGGSAVAQTDDSTSSAPSTQAAAPDPSQGGHMANGVTEELLTGDTADKVTAAAKEAVPDGTIERVETDAESSPYEAHVTKADGTHVTVKVASDFTVTSVEDGAR
jgi:hypothetical protein